jgi:hypothetical protein
MIPTALAGGITGRCMRPLLFSYFSVPFGRQWVASRGCISISEHPRQINGSLKHDIRRGGQSRPQPAICTKHKRLEHCVLYLLEVVGSKPVSAACWSKAAAPDMCESTCAGLIPAVWWKPTNANDGALLAPRGLVVRLLGCQAPCSSVLNLCEREYLAPGLCSTSSYGALHPGAWPRAGSDWVASSHPIAPRLPCPQYRLLSNTVLMSLLWFMR